MQAKQPPEFASLNWPLSRERGQFRVANSGGCLACIQPRYRLLRGGAVGVPCQLLEHDQASCMLCLLLVSCCDGGSTPSVRKAAQAEVLAPDKVPTMILFETRGL